MVAPLKPGWTVEEVYQRAERPCTNCRSTARPACAPSRRIVPGIGLRGFERCARWPPNTAAIDIEICVFPQEG